MGRQTMMLTFCLKCIIMCYIKGLEMIPKIFKRSKINMDYVLQA
jgi:hypothetical protein